VTAPGWPEQAGDLSHCLVAGLDVAHDGARGLVPGPGHDQLQRDLLVAEAGRGGVAELVEVQAAGCLVPWIGCGWPARSRTRRGRGRPRSRPTERPSSGSRARGHSLPEVKAFDVVVACLGRGR
jgi:hypothetical protein